MRERAEWKHPCGCRFESGRELRIGVCTSHLLEEFEIELVSHVEAARLADAFPARQTGGTE